MGLFDAFSKIAKDVVKDVVSDVVKETTTGNTVHTNVSVDGNVAPQEQQEVNTSFSLQEVDFVPVGTDGCVEHATQGYFTDEYDNEKVLVERFCINEAFHRTDVAAMEIKAVYVYAPDVPVDEYVEVENFDTPHLFLGFDEPSHDIVEDFLNCGRVKENTFIEKVNGCFAEYRTRLVRRVNNEECCVVCYNFHTEGDKELFYQLGVSYPKNLEGTDEERTFLHALNQAMESYREEVVDEWIDDLE